MGGGVVKKFEHDCDGCQFLESFYVKHSNFPGWGNPTGGNHVEAIVLPENAVERAVPTT